MVEIRVGTRSQLGKVEREEKKAKDLTWGEGRDGALMAKRGGSRGRDTEEDSRGDLRSQRSQMLLECQGG